MNRIEYIHKKHYIHRDIKPENFMTGRKEFKAVLYLIDFGLSKKYIDPKTGKHVKYKDNHRLNGTARFASIHALEGYELSRRDDLESLCYVLVYLLKGNLPWTRLKNKNKYEKYKIILNMKKKMSEDILIGDKNNQEFIDFIKYCRELKFEESPDYNYLRGLMIKSISKNNKVFDNLGSSTKNDSFEYSLNGLSSNKLNRNKRTCSVKRVKINLVSNKLLNANKRNEITDYDNKIINETKSGSLAYIGKKVRNYSSYKKSDFKNYQRLCDYNKKKQNSFNDSDISDEVAANNIKFISVKYINNISTNNNNKNDSNKNDSINNNDANQVINKKKTAFRDNGSTASSSNENKKYSLTKLDLIKKGLGIEPKKTQMKKEEEDLEKNEEDNKDDGCIIL